MAAHSSILTSEILWTEEPGRKKELEIIKRNQEYYKTHLLDFPRGSDGKASTYNAGDLGSVSGSGRSPGEGNGNPLQYSCLGNPMDRGAWWATAHRVTKSCSAPSCCAFIHRVAFKEVSGHRVLINSGAGNRGLSERGTIHEATSRISS